jgi:hypothetical protein
LVSGTTSRCLCLLLAESVHNVDVPNTSSYVQVTLIGSTNFMFWPLVYSRPHVRSSYFTFLESSCLWIQGNCIHPDISRSLPIYHEVRFQLNAFCNHSDDINPGKISSNQNSCPLNRKNNPPRIRPVLPSGQDIEVTVARMVEFDVELHLRESAPKIPSRMGDEESGSDTAKFTKEL